MSVRVQALAVALVLAGAVSAVALAPEYWEDHVVTISEVQADRDAPPDVPPVEHRGVRYQQDLDGAELGGRLAAVDPRTGKRLWTLEVYRVGDYDAAGVDAIGRYFRSMTLVPERETLLIEDEGGGRYAVDLATRTVTALDRGPAPEPPLPPVKPKPKP